VHQASPVLQVPGGDEGVEGGTSPHNRELGSWCPGEAKAMSLKDPEKRKAYHKKYHRAWYRRNRKWQVLQVSENRKRIRRWFTSFKKTLKCSKCPEKFFACLDFHHKKGSTKEAGISYMVNMGFSRERILKEVKKCVVLCANCHRKHHHRRRI
jgi:hypothetical protein